MYGRKNRGKRGFRRAVVTLLTFVMLVSTCFPSLVANAAEESEIAVAAAESQEITAGAATQESQSLTAEEEAEPNGAGSQPPEDGTTSQGTKKQAGSEEPQPQTTEETPESNGTESQDTEDGTKSEGTEEQTESEESQTTEEETESNGTGSASQNTEDGTESKETEDTAGNNGSTDDEVAGKNDDTNAIPAVSEAANYMNQITELQTEASSLNAEDENIQAKCADIYARLMDINTNVVEAKDNGTITKDEYTTAYNAIGGVMSSLASLGFDPNMPAVIPDTPDLTVEAGKTGYYEYGYHMRWQAVDANGNKVSGIKVSYSNNQSAVKVEVESGVPAGTYTIQYYAGWPTDGHWVYAFTVEVKAASGSGTTSTALKYYNSKNYVAYDVAQSDSAGYNDTNGTYVTSVTLNGTSVSQANSNLGNYHYPNGLDNGRYDDATNAAGSTLSAYYLGVETDGNDVSKTLVIKPAVGYYVTQVTVACCDPGKVYSCGTWANGEEFTQTFNVSTGGDLTMQLPASAFCHGNSNNDGSRKGVLQYFILIKVAPVPEPLYVAYDAGMMADADTIFSDPDQWTSANTGNVYGMGGGNETQFTQFKYAYEHETEVGTWKHYANDVTEEAKIVAAKQGYYFAGWKPVYYVNCDANYNFNQVYSEPADLIAPNADVRLITHVKLTAQWAPVKLNVQKKVEGLTSYAGTYTVQLKKDDANIGDTHDFTVTGSNTSDAWTTSPITPGTYTIVETSPEIGSVVTDSGTNKYLISTTYSDPVTVTADAIAKGEYREGTLIVTNTYSDATPALKLVKNWQDASGNDLTGTATAYMPAVTFNIKCDTHSVNKTVTLRYDANDTTNYGWVKTMSAEDLQLPEGCAISDLNVSETVPTGYTLVDGSVKQSSEEDTENKTIYTVFTATNQQDTTSITVTKQVTGNMGDVNKEFNFTATLSGGTMTPGNYGNYTVAEGGATITFTLKDNGTVTISNVPIGAALTLKESNVSAYEVSMNDTVVKAKDQNGDATSNAITVASGLAIAVVNKNEALIDTGISLPTFPFILLFSTVAVLGCVYLIGKRRYGEF